MEKVTEILLKIWEVIKNIGIDLLIIAIILLISRLALNFVSARTRKAMQNLEKLEDKNKANQIKTKITLTHSANRYFVYAVVIFLILKQIGLSDQVSSAFLAAGIGGLIISLGVQGIVKDIVAGLVLLFERQFYVGDYVKIGDYEGTVTSIALRVTYLKSAGKQIIIPNGDIRNVVNYSRNEWHAFIVIPTPYDSDSEKVISLLQRCVERYQKEHAELLTEKKGEVVGLTAFGERGAEITVHFETQKEKHWQVEREFRLLAKQELARNGIIIPAAGFSKVK